MIVPRKRERARSGIMRGPQRQFDRHRRHIRTLECVCARVSPEDYPARLICDGRIECCHLRLGSHAPMSDKPEDYFTFPGCAAHHAQSHRIGEATFQALYGLDLRAICLALARQSPDLEMRAAARAAGVI